VGSGGCVGGKLMTVKFLLLEAGRTNAFILMAVSIYITLRFVELDPSAAAAMEIVDHYYRVASDTGSASTLVFEYYPPLVLQQADFATSSGPLNLLAVSSAALNIFHALGPLTRYLTADDKARLQEAMVNMQDPWAVAWLFPEYVFPAVEKAIKECSDSGVDWERRIWWERGLVEDLLECNGRLRVVLKEVQQWAQEPDERVLALAYVLECIIGGKEKSAEALEVWNVWTLEQILRWGGTQLGTAALTDFSRSETFHRHPN
jgi:hypothetical protein